MTCWWQKTAETCSGGIEWVYQWIQTNRLVLRVKELTVTPFIHDNAWRKILNRKYDPTVLCQSCETGQLSKDEYRDMYRDCHSYMKYSNWRGGFNVATFRNVPRGLQTVGRFFSDATNDVMAFSCTLLDLSSRVHGPFVLCVVTKTLGKSLLNLVRRGIHVFTFWCPNR